VVHVYISPSVRLFAQVFFFGLLWPAFSIAAQSAGLQRVLVLYSDERLLPANVIFDHSFRTNIQADANTHFEFHSEFLDVSRFSREAQQENQRDFLREKYRDYPPDLIVAVSASAVAFLIKYRASLFTEVPVVYLTWQGEAPPGDLRDQKAAAISIPGSVGATVRLALDLQQDTRRIAIVTGSSQRDKTLAEEARKGSAAFENRVAFMWLTDLSLPKLREELAHLPDHTVVLYLTMFQDATGNRLTPQEALDQFASASRVPIYGYYDTYLGHGIVGGSFVTFEEIGRKAAQMGLRILSGESPQDVARSEISQSIPMLDWRKLRRWKISERRLPPGSVMLFREATYWEKHHWLILGVVSASLIQGLLIAVLFVQLRRRRQAEAFLRESEERLNLATTSAGAGLWAIDQTTRQIWLTDRAKELFGLSSKAPDWENLLSAVHPDDREQMQNSIEEALRTGNELSADFRVVYPDGSARWVSSRGRVQSGSHPKLQRLMGACVDITRRKLAEETARTLSGRLIYAQEAERTRLARDLHDDLSQSLALLSIELEMFGQREPPERGPISARMREFSAQVKRLSSDVHRLSHELHPAKLEQLGLVAALRGFCEEFAVAREMAIEFADRSVPRAVPRDTALCLYRVAQEALQNVVKHSGAPAARVELDMEGNELRLVIADDGVGFNPKMMLANSSLGLISMGERVRFVHGLLSVESQAGRGTRVEVRVPIAGVDESLLEPMRSERPPSQ
jgi:PAS domain S-box-containing protein